MEVALRQVSMPRLYFLGTRDYVNGLTLFEEMISVFKTERPDLFSKMSEIKNFRVNRFVRSECYMTISLAEDPTERSTAQLNVSLNNSEAVKICLHEREGEFVEERRPDYDRGIYIAKEKYAGSVHHVNIQNIKSEKDFIRGIVEAVHREICSLAAKRGIEKGISWAYLTKLPWPKLAELKNFGEFSLERKRSFEMKDRQWELRKLIIPGLTSKDPAEIGFFYNLKK